MRGFVNGAAELLLGAAELDGILPKLRVIFVSGSGFLNEIHL